MENEMNTGAPMDEMNEMEKKVDEMPADGVEEEKAETDEAAAM